MDKQRPLDRPLGLNKKMSIEIIAGASAGLCSAILVNPLDVVKVRLQNSQTNQSFSRVLKDIVYKEGVKGLFRGLSATTIAYIVDRALWFPIYQQTRLELQNKFDMKWNSLTPQLYASIFASLVTATLSNPVWVVRTRLFIQPVDSSIPNSPYYYTSFFHGLKTIKQKEGILALYKGLGPSLLGISHVAIQFPLYEQLKLIALKDHEIPSHSKILLASSLSKIMASSLTYPHEVLRTRLQTQTNENIKYKSLWQSVRLIHSHEGLYGFYKVLFFNFDCVLGIWY
jgi:solute carrier family 25 folate transporter 32